MVLYDSTESRFRANIEPEPCPRNGQAEGTREKPFIGSNRLRTKAELPWPFTHRDKSFG